MAVDHKCTCKYLENTVDNHKYGNNAQISFCVLEIQVTYSMCLSSTFFAKRRNDSHNTYV